jgi:hypothetical protein
MDGQTQVWLILRMSLRLCCWEFCTMSEHCHMQDLTQRIRSSHVIPIRPTHGAGVLTSNPDMRDICTLAMSTDMVGKQPCLEGVTLRSSSYSQRPGCSLHRS